MVRRRVSAVSNHEARDPSIETREGRAPQDEAERKYGPHPEELAKQASRRMAVWHGLAAILRDAHKGALLRMRSESERTG
jgi:hypothetical protein